MTETYPEADEGSEEAREAEAHLQSFLERHTSGLEAGETPPDIEAVSTEIVEMINAFKSEHSLEALFAITDLRADESREHPVREPARLALMQITTKLDVLRLKTDISTDRFADLYNTYMEISRAVGWINEGQVIHDRD